MTQQPIAAALITEVLGWKSTDDGQHALIGLKLHDGSEAAIALTPDSLDEIIAAIIGAKAAFPVPRLGPSHEFAMAVSQFDFGHTPSTGKFFLRLRFASGGNLGLTLDPVVTALLSEQLQVAVGTMAPPPDTPRN